jgi:hypothetical protein
VTIGRRRNSSQLIDVIPTRVTPNSSLDKGLELERVQDCMNSLIKPIVQSLRLTTINHKSIKASSILLMRYYPTAEPYENCTQDKYRNYGN